MFKIAISLRVIKNSSYYEKRDAISHDWIQFLSKHDIYPLLVPNNIQDLESFLNCFGTIHGVLLTSGNDVGIKTSADFAPERDIVEKKLLEFAEVNSLPLLGVCRGLHFLNHYYGGKVVPLSSKNTPSCCHVKVVHPVRLCREEVELPDYLGKSIKVNSYHNNVVMRENLSHELIPFATTEQGIVEGVKHRKLPFWAIQWHPERDNTACEIDNWLINRLKQ